MGKPTASFSEIRRTGRAWTSEELEARWPLMPESLDVYEGRLLIDDAARLQLLGLLLENLGADAVVQRIGTPSMWRAAVATLPATEPDAPAPRAPVDLELLQPRVLAQLRGLGGRTDASTLAQLLGDVDERAVSAALTALAQTGHVEQLVQREQIGGVFGTRVRRVTWRLNVSRFSATPGTR